MHDTEPAGGRSSSARPLSWQEARQAAWSTDLAGPPRELVVRAVVITCVLFAFAGLLGAWLWAEFADPPVFEVVRTMFAEERPIATSSIIIAGDRYVLSYRIPLQ